MESAAAGVVAATKVGHTLFPRRKSLITDEPWDFYHLEALLPLKETYRENKKFGFLLRHYWIPATILTFRQSSQTTFSDGRVEPSDVEIERSMARCRSNECLWREKIRPASRSEKNGERPVLSEMLCSYDCYEQTFWSAKPILFTLPTAEQKTDARRQALHRLPFLCPPGPAPLGFSWYAKVGDDYMNFRLDAEEQVGDTSVLVIRREGRFTTWVSPDSKNVEAKKISVVQGRQGVTLFAWNRGAVLEDRFVDQIIKANGHFESFVGETNRCVTRLIRSCPENLSRSATSCAGRPSARDDILCDAK